MKTGKLLILIAGFSLIVSFRAVAQETLWYTEIQKEIEMGKELFRTGKYNAAYYQFEKIRDMADEKSEIVSEASYYMALSSLRAGHSTGEQMMANFLNNYADSPYSNYAQFYYAEYQFERNRFQVALKTLSNVDSNGLSENDRVKAIYMTGYSYMMTDELDLAANQFFMIKDKDHLLKKPAIYYWSHINYLKGNYDAALDGFRQLDNDPNFSKVIPMYVSQIYYKQERYSDVVNYIVPIINEVEAAHKPELNKIVGDSYFHLKRFDEAIKYLEQYHQTSGTKSREDNYLLGYSYYIIGQHEKSIPYLEGATKGSDALAQNAFYHLADAYIRTGEKEKARVAFGSASDMEFDDAIREDALFNYAKLTYELSYSPFNETIKAFDKYISLYPNSDRNTTAYQYLVEVFMITRNYRDAIASIEKIKVKNAAINQAYQRVTYYRGLELFGNSSYDQAIDYFDKSLQNVHNADLAASARFWRAESLYRTGDYSAAIRSFNQFLAASGAFSSAEYNDANYSLGYSYFKLEDYKQAENYFRKYLSGTRDRNSNKVADAYNRLGDSFFQQRDYTSAVANYKQAYNMRNYDADYALYQLAFTSGLQRDKQAKIDQLNTLVSTFPKSTYIDDAHYELGQTYQLDGKTTDAKREYQYIIDNSQRSAYYPKALLQMGLINYNQGDYQNSLRYYKEVAEKYGGTQEAQAALTGIRNCYVEMNDVDSYFTYANRVGGGTTVTVNAQDSLTYMTAEKQFMAGDPNAANQLRRYLQQYPNGSFVLNANFYLGEALYSSSQYSQALENYMYVAQQPSNIFSEQALSKASELLYNGKRYNEALDIFDRLEAVSTSKWNTVRAIAGKMNCNFYLEKYQNAINEATRLSSADKLSEIMQRDANFVTGKSFYMLQNYDKAIPELKKVATETNSAEGAESKYLISEIYYHQKNTASAEKEIMDFISKGTQHQFWLAKSFILMADIYSSKNDDFQAKHTLKSLIENYPEQNDGILSEAKRKLSQIEEREKQEEESVRSNPMQINLD
ncbi:MAG: tetratricopeptide repeat protein [Prolixibacteraceae bacterium]|nr:tetratricopeptide repeat protein [Prolixibacteraceae bacterium]